MSPSSGKPEARATKPKQWCAGFDGKCHGEGPCRHLLMLFVLPQVRRVTGKRLGTSAPNDVFTIVRRPRSASSCAATRPCSIIPILLSDSYETPPPAYLQVNEQLAVAKKYGANVTLQRRLLCLVLELLVRANAAHCPLECQHATLLFVVLQSQVLFEQNVTEMLIKSTPSELDVGFVCAVRYCVVVALSLADAHTRTHTHTLVYARLLTIVAPAWTTSRHWRGSSLT